LIFDVHAFRQSPGEGLSKTDNLVAPSGRTRNTPKANDVPALTDLFEEAWSFDARRAAVNFLPERHPPPILMKGGGRSDGPECLSAHRVQEGNDFFGGKGEMPRG
jgi:hypothetical protein